MMKQKLRVLNLEDNSNDSELIQSMLSEAWPEVELIRIDAKDEFISAIEQCKFDIILGDYALPDFDGIAALLIAKEKCPDTPYVFVSGVIGEELAIETLKKGAVDYVLKNRLSKLVPAVKRALQEAEEIVSRRKLEEILKAAKKNWEATFDAVSDPMFIHDSELKIVRANKAYQEAAGMSFSEIIGKPYYEVFPKMGNPFNCCLNALKLQEEVIATKGKIYKIRFYPLKTNAYEYSVHVLEDITEKKRAEEAIKENEDRYKRLVESVTDYIYTVQVEDGRPVKTTHGPACIAITGYASEDYEADQNLWLKMVYDEDKEAVWKQAEAALSGNAASLEHRIISKDGKVKWVRNTPVPHYDEKGRLISYDGLVSDISERRQVEEALRESEERYRTLAESAQDVIFIIKPDGYIQYMNSFGASQHGRQPEEIIGRSIEELFSQDLVEQQKQKIREVLETGKDVYHELKIPFPDKEQWGEAHLTPLKDAAGNVLAILGIVRDITDRKMAEEVRAFLANITEHATDAIEGIDLDTNIISWNSGAETFFGYSAQEIIGRPHSLIVPKEAQEECRERFKKATMEGFVRAETERIKKDGRQFPVEMTLTALKDDKGEHTGFVCITRDITERKKAEAKLKEYSEHLEDMVRARTKELEDANIELEVINKELEQRKKEAEIARLHADAANKAKSDFLANMSHELRTPLNSIIGFSEMLTDKLFGALNAKQAGYVKNVYDSGKHLLNLINDILDLSKVEAGKIEFEVSRFPLKDIMFAAMTMLKEKAMKHRIDMSIDIASDADIEIEADERKLKQIMFNLLSNAVKFTNDGGKVRVSARKVNSEQLIVNSKKLFTDDYSLTTKGDSIEISVSDTGIGIKKEDMQKLFKEFSQIESAYTKSHEGTGLGLILTKKMIELHGGRIWAESEFGKGSTFSFVIPCRRKEGSSVAYAKEDTNN